MRPKIECDSEIERSLSIENFSANHSKSSTTALRIMLMSAIMLTCVGGSAFGFSIQAKRERFDKANQEKIGTVHQKKTESNQNYQKRALIRTLTGHTGTVNSITFSPDGQVIASGSSDDTIKLWKRDGTLIKTIASNGVVINISFSPDGQTLIASDSYRTIKIKICCQTHWESSTANGSIKLKKVLSSIGIRTLRV